MNASELAVLAAWPPARSADSPPQHAETVLVERLQRGDAAAVGEAYDRHHATVRRFACRFVGDAASAEDLVHEVFVTLPRAIRRFSGESSLGTFLVSIAVNHARHHLRAAARRRATRCLASCECALGQSCTAGYCESDTPPPTACTVSCDCPKGMSCVAGACQ